MFIVVWLLLTHAKGNKCSLLGKKFASSMEKAI